MDDRDLMSDTTADSSDLVPGHPDETFEERFHAITSSAPVGIYELALDGTAVFANKRCAELAGIDEEASSGLGWFTAIHPDDRDRVTEAWGEAIQTREEFELEYRFLHPDGKIVWVYGQATYLRDKDGEITGLLGTLLDISKRKRAEQTAALGGEVINNMAEGLCLVRGSDGIVLYANPTFERIMGYEPGELEGIAAAELLPPEDTDSPSQIFAKVRAGRQVSYETRCLRKDGERIWCRATTSTLEHPEHGTVYVAVQEDITTERKAREALREAEERFRRAFEDSATGMALIEGTGEQIGMFREVNAALVGMSGYTPEEFAELHYWDLVHPEDVEKMRAGVLNMIAGEVRSFQAEMRMRAKDASVKWIAFSVSLIRDAAGAPQTAVVQAQDVTERKRFESELRYLADHDPLTGLYNRRRFATELEREVSAAHRYRTQGALLELDLDNFKVINDSLGHAAGDELLATLATAMRGRLRTSDIVARLGGDEFGIILPHADPDRAILVAESLRELVRTIATNQAPRSPVSASVGIVSFGVGTEQRTVDRFVADADAAMYAAKQSGRDQIRVFSPGERAALRSVS
jgi:diguanylate cyclase (GGDEF)-like protein/PAS domain S-box-containing protein